MTGTAGRIDKLGTNIAFAGLTAAGKTTHARLLAAELGYEFVSATEIIVRLANLELGSAEHVWFEHFETLERARADDRIDCLLEAELLQLATSRRRVVFDTWALPWISTVDMVRLYLQSDSLSRTWKCFVSQGDRPERDLAQCARLIAVKDETTRVRLLRRHGFDVCRNLDISDLILDNSAMMTSPTRAAADDGIRRFAPYVGACVALQLRGDRGPLAELRARYAREYARTVRRLAAR